MSGIKKEISHSLQEIRSVGPGTYDPTSAIGRNVANDYKFSLVKSSRQAWVNPWFAWFSNLIIRETKRTSWAMQPIPIHQKPQRMIMSTRSSKDDSCIYRSIIRAKLKVHILKGSQCCLAYNTNSWIQRPSAWWMQPGGRLDDESARSQEDCTKCNASTF